MASSGDTATPAKHLAADTEIVSVDLPAPEGWRKKFTPKKGGTPKRNEVVFISPTGEDVTNKRQLDQYLRSHPGGPPASEFDWGTGDTPRRSARLSSKTKATETPEHEKPKKREKKSASKEGAKYEAPEEVKDACANEEKKSADVQMEDAEGHAEKTKEVDAAVEAVTEGETEKKSGETTKDVEDKTDEAEKEKTTGEKKDENAEEKPGDFGMLLPEGNEEPAEMNVKDGVVPSENDRDDTVLKGHSSMSHEGGQANHQPKASPVNC